jgi:two-component system response regulator BaeR
MNPRILIVEDTSELASVLADYLQSAGYETEWFKSGSGVVEHVRSDPPALVLLDIMLPEKDGMTVCTEIRRLSNVPIIMVTARVEEIDRLLGLELGADEYICKPFSPREVVARVKAILRRTMTNASSLSPADRALVIDEMTHEASLDGQRLDLTPAEFRLLARLDASPGVVFSRGQLLDGIHDDHRVVTDRTVDTHIKNLRRKLQAIRDEETIIRSIYGIGYRLDPPPPGRP